MEAKELKSILETRGIKQVFIARKLKVSKALVNQWIKGHTPIAESKQIELKSLLSLVN